MQYNIQPIKAYLSRNTEKVTQMLGSQRFRTETKQQAGRKPKWSETFAIRSEPNEKLKLKAYDEDVTVDDLVGEGEVDLASFNLGVEERFVSLKYAGKPAGKVLLKVQSKQRGYQSFNSPVQSPNNYTSYYPTSTQPMLHSYTQPLHVPTVPSYTSSHPTYTTSAYSPTYTPSYTGVHTKMQQSSSFPYSIKAYQK